jgi:hypothetical protein
MAAMSRKPSPLRLVLQRIASALANRVKMEQKDLWQEIRKRSWQIIAHNGPVARELIARLERTETLQRRALTTPLEGVQKFQMIGDGCRRVPSTCATEIRHLVDSPVMKMSCHEARRIAANVAKLRQYRASARPRATQGHSQLLYRWPCKRLSQRRL